MKQGSVPFPAECIIIKVVRFIKVEVTGHKKIDQIRAVHFLEVEHLIKPGIILILRNR